MTFHFSYRAGAALVALALCAPATRATDAPDASDTAARYTHALPLQVSGKQAVVQLRLPRDVYLHARTRDLADLRVFDSAGAAQPFALTWTTAAQQRSLDLPCRVFPIRQPARAGGRLDDLQVRLARDGTVVSVTPHADAAGDADTLAGLVLDLGTLPQGATVSSLTLAPPSGARNYSAQLIAEASDDLQDWQPLAETTVSWLVNANGDSVSSNRIAFSAQRLRYVRLRWADGQPAEFAAVTAQANQTQDAPQQWDDVTLPGQRVAGGRDLVYAAPLAVPAERVGVVLREQNVVLPVAIGRYAPRPPGIPGQTAAPDFIPFASATFYKLNQDGAARVAGDVAIPETHLAQWVLRPKADVAALPDLHLRWRPATLVFVAGGKPPYTLAFGRTDAPSARRPLDQVAPGFDTRDLGRLETAGTGKLVEQHAGAAADAAGQDAAQGRIRWLWALLVAGVGALAWMAWRLVAQLKRDDAGRAPE
jgi:hypothetical protein